MSAEGVDILGRTGVKKEEIGDIDKAEIINKEESNGKT